MKTHENIHTIDRQAKTGVPLDTDLRMARSANQSLPRHYEHRERCGRYRRNSCLVAFILTFLLAFPVRAVLPKSPPGRGLEPSKPFVPFSFEDGTGFSDWVEKEKAKEQEMLLQCIVAGAIVVGGVVIGVGMFVFCKKKFPPPVLPPHDPGCTYPTNEFTSTNCPNPNCPLVVESEAAVFALGQNVGNPGTASFEFLVGADGTIETKPIVESATPDEFFAGLARHGLPNFNYTPLRTGEIFYAKNGQSVSSNSISVTVSTNGTFTTRIGNGANRRIIWRSSDLVNWEAMSTNYIPDGKKLQVIPTSSSPQEFYKITP